MTVDNLDFTGTAWDQFYNTVDSASFQTDDSDLIYQALEDEMMYIPFGEYLKRYVYQASGMTEDYAGIPLEEYVNTIVACFQEFNAPTSFTPTSTRPKAAVKNWLTQNSAKRSVVLLLGFGLRMSVEDVNDFLQKGIREQGINFKDPNEVICWYCYKNRYGFPKYQALVSHFENSTREELGKEGAQAFNDLGLDDSTRVFRMSSENITNEAALFAFLANLKTSDNKTRFSKSMYDCFTGLYNDILPFAASYYNEMNEEDLESFDDGKKHQRQVVDAGEITTMDVEKLLYSSIPRDSNGNMVPSKQSNLHEKFVGYRLNRQRMADILARKSEAGRYDIITLSFLYFALHDADQYPGKRRRYDAFIDFVNQKLSDCFLEELSVSNPYESFVLMCVLADDPLGTFADVWEMSYDENEED